MKASTQSESAIIIPGILYFGFSWTRPIKLMFVLLCSPARSSEFFMDRFPFELHKDSLICCLSVFKAKRVWFQLIAPLVSKQDFDETLLKNVHLWSSDTGPGTQNGRIRMWKASLVQTTAAWALQTERKTCFSFRLGPPDTVSGSFLVLH